MSQQPSGARGLGEAIDDRPSFPSGVFDDLPESVVVTDGAGHVRYANAACESLFGVDPSALIGRQVADFAIRHEVAERRPRVGASPCALRGHVELRYADGDTRWASYSLSPLSDGSGAIAILHDETERRLDDQQRSRTHDELEQTIRAVSHDLRSPLVSVLGFSRLLRDDFAALLGERGTHYLERIAEAGRTMENLIRELLDFARIGHGGERRSWVDPREVLLQLRGELKPRLDNLEVELHVPDDAPLLLCNRTRLYQLFSNLIGNALDHMGPCDKPEIEVQICEDGAWHRLTVLDNGRGVAPDERDRIFEMFHSIPREGGRKGTGIGLAIVKKIAELHGGRVWVESSARAGAAFHVLLPRH